MKAYWIEDSTGRHILNTGVPGFDAKIIQPTSHPQRKPWGVCIGSQLPKDSRLYFETLIGAKNTAEKILKLRAENLLKMLQ